MPSEPAATSPHTLFLQDPLYYPAFYVLFSLGGHFPLNFPSKILQYFSCPKTKDHLQISFYKNIIQNKFIAHSE